MYAISAVVVGAVPVIALGYLLCALGLAMSTIIVEFVLSAPFARFHGAVGTSGAVALISLPISAGFGGALLSEAIGDLRVWVVSDSSQAGVPSFIWWSLAALTVFIGAPVGLTRLSERRGDLDVAARIGDLRKDPGSDDPRMILDSLDCERRRVLQRRRGRRRLLFELPLAFLAVALQTLALVGVVGSVVVVNVWALIIGSALIATYRLTIAPKILDRELSRLSTFRDQTLALMSNSLATADSAPAWLRTHPPKGVPAMSTVSSPVVVAFVVGLAVAAGFVRTGRRHVS